MARDNGLGELTGAPGGWTVLAHPELGLATAERELSVPERRCGPAPDLSAGDPQHLVRRAVVQDMTTSTGSGGPTPLRMCAVPSADGVASLLATVLVVSERPARLMLEELGRTEISIEVISRTDRDLTASEHYQLDAGPITSAQHHAGLLRTMDGTVAAETELLILPQRLPADTRAATPRDEVKKAAGYPW